MESTFAEYEDFQRRVEVDEYGNYTAVEPSERFKRLLFVSRAKQCGMWMPKWNPDCEPMYTMINRWIDRNEAYLFDRPCVFVFRDILGECEHCELLQTDETKWRYTKEELQRNTVVWEKEIAPWLVGTGTTIDMLIETFEKEEYQIEECFDTKEYTGLRPRKRQRIYEQTIIDSDLPSDCWNLQMSPFFEMITYWIQIEESRGIPKPNIHIFRKLMNNSRLLNVLCDPIAPKYIDVDIPEDMRLLNDAYAKYLEEEYLEKQLANCILNEIDQLQRSDCWARVFVLEEMETI
jgi:hypothetical protein